MTIAYERNDEENRPLRFANDWGISGSFGRQEGGYLLTGTSNYSIVIGERDCGYASFSPRYRDDVWECKYCHRLNPLDKFECFGCGCGRMAR